MGKILVTGAAGFIGSHLSYRLCENGHDVVGIDNMNDYYEVSLKTARLKEFGQSSRFTFIQGDISDRDLIDKIFKDHGFDNVVNLAAQAGVRYSIDNPYAYVDSNLVGFINILEACRHNKVKHLVYASSSSVYGTNTKLPFSVEDNVDHPISLYAATKKANELMAHSYAHLYKLPCTGLRFFTVYGPWGRPDMSYYKFAKSVFDGKAIDVYNNGDMSRDFTYIDDIIEGIVRVLDVIPKGEEGKAPYSVYNIGNNAPENLLDMISILEEEIGITIKKNLMPMQPGDVSSTYADVDDLVKDTGFKPDTTLRHGIRQFVSWFRKYHGNHLDGQNIQSQ